jgi:peptidoglycan/LPS O-acetylase OafA/YrhL
VSAEEVLVKKWLLGIVLGGLLGIFDGLSALVSAPETQPMILGIVIGSTFKGVIAGALIGWYAYRVPSMSKGIIVGLVVGAFLAFLIAAMPNEAGGHYWWEIMLPGTLVGLIVGYATQRFGRGKVQSRTV